MKTINIYITLFTMALGLLSCDDFIAKEPIDQIPAEDFFKDEQSAESAVIGLYRSLQSSYYYGQTQIVIPEFAAGHLRHISNFPEYVEYRENRIRIDNPWALNLWTNTYNIINAANNIIEGVPNIAVFTNEDMRQQYIREAKFIRALVYFNAVRSWGDIPLIVTPTTPSTDRFVSRTPASEVYLQIVADLEDAVNLPPAETIGRASQFAAKALLSKVHLYLENYDQAAALAADVIYNGGYTLTENYSAIWLAGNSSESIFELQFDAQSTNVLATVSNPTASALFFATDTTYQLFEDDDIRRDFTINLQTDATGATVYYMGKYRNFNPAVQNVPVIRLSEVYLIYAEALARVNGSPAGEPYTYYKAIRDRAGVETPEEGTFNLPSFITAVQREKRLELMFEGESWYDYTRTDLALSEMMVIPDENRYLFPIPQSERELNSNLGQNEAYL